MSLTEALNCKIQLILVVLGGRNESSTLKSVMRTKDGIFFEELPDLPVGSIEACLVIINDTHLFLAGGLGASTMTYMFDGSEWFEAGLLPGQLNLKILVYICI